MSMYRYEYVLLLRWAGVAAVRQWRRGPAGCTPSSHHNVFPHKTRRAHCSCVKDLSAHLCLLCHVCRGSLAQIHLSFEASMTSCSSSILLMVFFQLGGSISKVVGLSIAAILSISCHLSSGLPVLRCPAHTSSSHHNIFPHKTFSKGWVAQKPLFDW